METVFSTTMANRRNVLPDVLREVNRFLDPHAPTAKIRNAVNLVLEESLMNIIRYGYDDDGSHGIDVLVEVDAAEVRIRLEDEGKAFNPLTVPRPDKSKPAWERIEDGLGIHLVRQMMRSMSYQRTGEKNIFEIWINRSGS